MCEIVRAMIAEGLFEGVKLSKLNDDSFSYLNCPGQGMQSRICAVAKGAASQTYSWYILLEAQPILINERPKWKMDNNSEKILKEKMEK